MVVKMVVKKGCRRGTSCSTLYPPNYPCVICEGGHVHGGENGQVRGGEDGGEDGFHEGQEL